MPDWSKPLDMPDPSAIMGWQDSKAPPRINGFKPGNLYLSFLK